MKKEDLVIGNTYKIIGGGFSHSFRLGEVVTFKRDDGSSSPWFVNNKSDGQYVHVDWVAPIPQVKVGDKVRIINEGNNSSGGKYYRKGDVGIVTNVNTDGINVDLAAYNLPLNKPRVDNGDYELVLDTISELKLTYDNAKAAYETAVREQEAAEAKAKEALKFTEADVKESFVVEHDSSRGGLRLVVLSYDGGGATFIDTRGKQSNSCTRTRLVSELNMMYKKTDKTLKDFCNA